MNAPAGAAASDGFVLEQGRVIAKKYVLDRSAGFGGMAQLWVATNQATGAEVCVKLLVPEPDGEGHDEEAVERFRREAHAAASLSHRAIVRVFDLLELDERGDAVGRGSTPHAYAIVMELLRGETLGDLLAKRGSLPVEEALDVFLPIVSALGHAHRASVIHRDLKPDNIFLAADPDGHVSPKVLDFGVSKLERADALTIDGVVVGTPCFMSPEQAKGARRIDARSDVFSAGILLYMMLSGNNPFGNEKDFASTVEAVVRREVPPLHELPPPIWSVIQQAIEKDPAKRWNDATEMGIALRKASGRRAATDSDPGIQLPATSPRTLDAVAETTTATRLGSASSPGARRRLTIVSAIVGVAFAIAVVGIVSALRSGSSAESTAGASPSPPETAFAPVVAAPSSSAATPPPTVSVPVITTTAPAAPGRGPRAAGTPSHRGGGAAATSVPSSSPTGRQTRKPGEEPHNARDPGF